MKSLISDGVDLLLNQRMARRQAPKKSRLPWPTIAGGNPKVLSRITNDALFGLEDEP